MKRFNFLLTGVGGQGTLLASNILAEVGLRAGYEVKKSEVHGMAQRGGSVVSHVRWGEKVYSPLIGRGEADYLLAFEKLEALRYIEFLRPGALALINEQRIMPLSVSSGQDEYPGDERLQKALRAMGADFRFVPGVTLAGDLGNPRASNVVLLGALSAFLDVPPALWLEVIARCVPERFTALNQQAFQKGRALIG